MSKEVITEQNGPLILDGKIMREITPHEASFMGLYPEVAQMLNILAGQAIIANQLEDSLKHVREDMLNG